MWYEEGNRIRIYGFLELLRERRLTLFNKELLNEGLINSASYDKTIIIINNLLKKYSLEGNCFLYKGKDRLELDITDDNIYHKKSFHPEFIKLLDVVGYYISNTKLNKDAKLETDISFSNFIKNKPILYLNKKYDIVKYNKDSGELIREPSISVDMPEYLYHVSEEQYLENIEKRGLVPQSYNYIQTHPERIYLFKNVEDCKDFIITKKIKKPLIFRVDVKTLYSIKLYEDPKYYPTIDAFYTYDNIQAFALKTIEIEI